MFLFSGYGDFLSLLKRIVGYDYRHEQYLRGCNFYTRSSDCLQFPSLDYDRDQLCVFSEQFVFDKYQKPILERVSLFKSWLLAVRKKRAFNKSFHLKIPFSSLRMVFFVKHDEPFKSANKGYYLKKSMFFFLKWNFLTTYPKRTIYIL